MAKRDNIIVNHARCVPAWPVLAKIMKCICAASCLLAIVACTKVSTDPTHPSTTEPVITHPVVTTNVTTLRVLPSATDPDITHFNQPHWVYIDRQIVVDHRTDLSPQRHELLLFLTGTGGNARGAQGLVNLAAQLGYHVISLMYPNDIPATVCAHDTNPEAFEEFRLAIIQGGRASYQNGRKEIVIERPESIEHRLIKLLQHLQRLRPEEGWGQFLNDDSTIKWESIAVAGQSQGGGHAALIGIKNRVARVMCFGAPKDYSKALNAPAAWYGQESATPKGLFFTFNHHQDPMGCTPEQLLSNLKALELDAFGPPAEVDEKTHPYHHARILYTGYPAVTVAGVESEGAKSAHGSAINTKNADRWKPVWTYMLTEPLHH